jgi:3-hydroxyisobutyrate dehydrogenase-like beta-hydroxyacid dehydrogenase
MSKGTVGVVGLGIMGGAIARNLAAAGWRVVGYDTNEKHREELAAAGVDIVADAAAVAHAAALILTVLPHPEALAITARAVLAAGMPKRIVAELSTLAIADKAAAEAALSAAGHTLIDAPLSGTGEQAKHRDLVVYASGDPAGIAAMQPVFADFAREAHDLGAFGNGSKMKFVANLLVAIHNVASAEAMVLGIKAGLDPHQVVKLIGSGAGNSRVFELRAPMMAEGRYEPATMKLSLWQKDMAVIDRFATELNCPTPLFDTTAPFYAAAIAQGRGAEDTAAVCAVMEKMAGVKRG